MKHAISTSKDRRFVLFLTVLAAPLIIDDAANAGQTIKESGALA